MAAKGTAAVLTLREAAQVLGVDPRTVSAGVKNGDLPSIRIGRRVMIPRVPFFAMLEQKVKK